MSHAPDIAHVHGRSGTFVVPARTPYDRQMLREHLEMLASRGRAITFEMEGTRWTVARRTPMEALCATCTRFPGRLTCNGADGIAGTCLDCAICPAATNTAERAHE